MLNVFQFTAVKIPQEHTSKMLGPAQFNTTLSNSPTSTLAAGLSTPIAFKIVAPSLVTCIVSFLPMLCKILSFKMKPRYMESGLSNLQ